MQYTIIGVQNNGQQIVLAQDVQEHSMDNIRREAVVSSASSQVRQESKYRSFIAIGTTANVTTVTRYNARGDVVNRSAGLV